jgi:hypothetical protein
MDRSHLGASATLEGETQAEAEAAVPAAAR